MDIRLARFRSRNFVGQTLLKAAQKSRPKVKVAMINASTIDRRPASFNTFLLMYD